MAKVTVDTSTCVGCGLCEQSCPEVFQVQVGKLERSELAHPNLAARVIIAFRNIVKRANPPQPTAE